MGLGCDRGTPLETVQQALAEALALANARIEDITAAASITLKADEPSLLALAQQHGWSLTFYTPEQLADIPVPNPSETVRRFTGTPSVSEAAALLAAGMQSTLIVEKHKLRGVGWKNATIIFDCLNRLYCPNYFLIFQPTLNLKGHHHAH